MLILVAILFFAMAATAGLFMATRILTGHRPPIQVALLHGGAGATGLGVLTWAVLSTGSFGSPGLALSVLGCNALLGFYLFSRHLREKPWPKFAVVTHGFAAVIGFTLIVTFALTRGSEDEPKSPFEDTVTPLAEPIAEPQAIAPSALPTEAPEPAAPEPIAVPEVAAPPNPTVAAAPSAPPETPAPAAPVAVKPEGLDPDALTFPFQFSHNSVDVEAVDVREYEKVKVWLTQCSGVVRVTGYTTPKGPAEGNYFVGLGRAMAVRDYLLAHGVNRHIRVRSKGGKASPPEFAQRMAVLSCDRASVTK